MNINQLRIIWTAIFLSTFVYAVIAWSSLHNGYVRDFGQELRQPMVLGLYGLCVVETIAAFVIGGLVMRSRGYRIGFIVRLALIESGCIVGLLAAFLLQDWRLYLGPWALGVLAFLRALPERERPELMP